MPDIVIGPGAERVYFGLFDSNHSNTHGTVLRRLPRNAAIERSQTIKYGLRRRSSVSALQAINELLETGDQS